ncbi:hypothetical protein ACS0TY_026431 [Phlomoides rotata]
MSFRGGGFNLKGNDGFLQPRHKIRRYSINFHHNFVKIMFFMVTITILCFLLNRSDHHIQKYTPFSLHKFYSADPASHENDENSLENTLKRASMKDHKTVILTTLNAAWTEEGSIFDLFMESFQIGIGTKSLLKHLVVIALDQKAYSRCLDVHPHCFALTTPGFDFSGNAHIKSNNYFKMIWRRVELLSYVLEMGYNFIFTDGDIMWLRDPFQRLDPEGDLNFASDIYRHNSTNLHNTPNAGFIYAKSNTRTIQFYKFWYAKKDDFPGGHDQPVLEKIKFDPFIQEMGVKIRFLDTAYVGGLCFPSKDLDVVVAMHANCCTVFKDKIHDIKLVLHDWKKYLENKTKSWASRSSWKCGLQEKPKTKIGGGGVQ